MGKNRGPREGRKRDGHPEGKGQYLILKSSQERGSYLGLFRVKRAGMLVGRKPSVVVIRNASQGEGDLKEISRGKDVLNR